MLVDDADHGPDLVFPMVCRDRKPDLLGSAGLYLAQGTDNIEHGAGKHKIEDGEQCRRQNQALQEATDQRVAGALKKLRAVVIGIDGDDQVAERQIFKLWDLQLLSEYPVGAE